MTQIQMIQAQTTVEATEAMLQDICTFRLNGRCGQGIKDHCFKMVMQDKCSKCPCYMTAENHKKELLRDS